MREESKNSGVRSVLGSGFRHAIAKTSWFLTWWYAPKWHCASSYTQWNERKRKLLCQSLSFSFLASFTFCYFKLLRVCEYAFARKAERRKRKCRRTVLVPPAILRNSAVSRIALFSLQLLARSPLSSTGHKNSPSRVFSFLFQA